MNAKTIRLFCSIILTVLIPVPAEITVPNLPETKLENPDSTFWLKRENWPEIINHNGVDYRLTVRVHDAEKNIKLDYFSGVRGDEEKITAQYSPNLRQLNLFEEENEGHVMYGPHFSWRNGKLRMKGFSFETGDWLHKYFDNNSQIWMKSFAIRNTNEGFMWLYDKDGNLVAYLRGPHDYDQKYEGVKYAELEGNEVSEDDFFTFLSNFMPERLESSDDENE